MNRQNGFLMNVSILARFAQSFSESLGASIIAAHVESWCAKVALQIKNMSVAIRIQESGSANIVLQQNLKDKQNSRAKIYLYLLPMHNSLNREESDIIHI